MTVQDVAPEQAAPPDSQARLRPRWRVSALVVVLVVIAGLVWWATRPPPIDDPTIAAQSMATAWSEFGLAAVEWAGPAAVDIADTDQQGPVVAPPPTESEIADLLGDLGSDTSLDGPVTSVATVTSVAPPVDNDPHSTTATLDVVWQLPRARTWEVTTTVTLVRHPGETTWAPVWDPAIVHPELVDGDVVEVRRQVAARGQILGTSGEVVVGPRQVTEIGLHPARIEDLDEVIAAIVGVMEDELGVTLDPQDLRADVAAADPDHFVPVVTLRNEDYQKVESVVFPLVGTTFRDGQRFIGPEGDYAQFTLGTVGEVTAEQLAENPGTWEPGDLAGRSGVQKSRDEDLRGVAGWSVVADRAETGNPTLHEVAPIPGDDIVITLDERVQRAAEAAIADTGHATAMAVVRPSDGHVLALANSPEATFDIARMGQLPPGSVFKVVTAAALMQELGVTAATPVGCPNTIEAGGRTISNAGSLALGPTVFAQVFANSCNTSFIDLSRDLAPTALHDAAAQLGVGATWEAGMTAFAGDVPVTEDARDLALASFGQGRTLVNPLDMATMMASVAQGGAVSPVIVTEVVSAGGGSDTDAGEEPTSTSDINDDEAGAPGNPLPDDVIETLQELTRLVVTDGSGRAMLGVPGAPVHGKTGTAEFTNADGALAKHVWFAGYQDDLAFAVVVTDTLQGSGGGTAGPLAADLLAAIAE